MCIGSGGVFFADIHVGCCQRVIGEQRGIKGQLGVLKGCFDALAGDATTFSFVVNHQGAAIGQAVDAVDSAHQGHGAQRRLFPDFAHFKCRTAGFVRCEPLQVAGAHTGPGRSKRQKFAAGQSEFGRCLVCRYINNSYPCIVFKGWRCF